MESLREHVDQSAQIQTLKVLIADDDTPTRMLLRAAITQWGYQVVEASDGEEAWEILQKPDPPWLLIIDWLMPRLDGLALCKRIKQKLTQYPYIILLTQLTGTTNIIKGLEAGADEFLSKPFNMAELRSRLSAGERIVKYTIKLSLQNQMLVAYTQLMNELQNIAHALSQQALSLRESMGQNLGTDVLEKIDEINENIANISELIDTFTRQRKKSLSSTL